MFEEFSKVAPVLNEVVARERRRLLLVKAKLVFVWLDWTLALNNIPFEDSNRRRFSSVGCFGEL